MYGNGEFPEHLFEVLGSGWDQDGQWLHLAPAGTAARWRWMVNAAREKYGVILRVTPGWNIYRPLRMQFIYRQRLGIMAAVPRTSSHGGTFNGRECMAIDVQNWADLAPGNVDLAWARFVALCRLAGFTVDFVTPRELWHIGDFNDIWNPPEWMEDDMFNDTDRRDLQKTKADAAAALKEAKAARTHINAVRLILGGSVKDGKLASAPNMINRLRTIQSTLNEGKTAVTAEELQEIIAGIAAGAGGSGLTPAQIQAAVEQGVREGLDGTTVTFGTSA